MISPDRAERVETLFGTCYAWKDDLITGHLKAYAAHTRNELSMVRSFLKAGDTVIDIGAHIGTLAIPFAQSVGPRGRVFAFEANRDNYALLELNIATNGLTECIRPVCAVVLAEAQSARMVLPDGGNSGMYYFLPQPELDGAAPPCCGIDDWLAANAKGTRIALIKIDAEGAELSALKSCRAVITRDRPILYCEINQQALSRYGACYDDLERLFSGWNYSLFRNTGDRNSTSDEFTLTPMTHLSEGGPFFDVLALPPPPSEGLRNLAAKLRSFCRRSREPSGDEARRASAG